MKNNILKKSKHVYIKKMKIMKKWGKTEKNITQKNGKRISRTNK